MQTTGPLVTARVTAIAAVAVQVTTTRTPLMTGFYVQAPAGNTAPVNVGIAGVTTNGFAVAAGTTSPLIPGDDLSAVWLISTGGSQEVRIIGG